MEGEKGRTDESDVKNPQVWREHLAMAFKVYGETIERMAPMSAGATKMEVAEKLQVKKEYEGRNDWLAVAINRIGGVTKAAKVLGVTRMAIYRWLREGLAEASFAAVLTLAREGHVEICDLARRLGRFRFPGIQYPESDKATGRSPRGTE